MAAGGLTSRQDDADVERLFYAFGIVVVLKLNHRHAVGVREKLFDFFLVGNRLCSLAYLDLNGSL